MVGNSELSNFGFQPDCLCPRPISSADSQLTKSQILSKLSPSRAEICPARGPKGGLRLNPSPRCYRVQRSPGVGADVREMGRRIRSSVYPRAWSIGSITSGIQLIQWNRVPSLDASTATLSRCLRTRRTGQSSPRRPAFPSSFGAVARLLPHSLPNCAAHYLICARWHSGHVSE